MVNRFSLKNQFQLVVKALWKVFQTLSTSAMNMWSISYVCNEHGRRWRICMSSLTVVPAYGVFCYFIFPSTFRSDIIFTYTQQRNFLHCCIPMWTGLLVMSFANNLNILYSKTLCEPQYFISMHYLYVLALLTSMNKEHNFKYIALTYCVASIIDCLTQHPSPDASSLLLETITKLVIIITTLFQ